MSVRWTAALAALGLVVAAGAADKKKLDYAPETGPEPHQVVAPPDVPSQRGAALRQAFDATMKDVDFLADAARMAIDIDPIDAAAAEQVLTRIYATPRAVVERVKAIYADRQPAK